MSSEYSSPEFLLVLKPRKKDGSPDGYRLEAYPYPFVEGTSPLASAPVPSLDTSALRERLTHLFQGKDASLPALGDFLARWLFFSPEGTTTLNPVGTIVTRLQGSVPIPQVFWQLDPELQDTYPEFQGGYVPFEALRHSRVLPLQVIRGSAGPVRGVEGLNLSGEPLAVAGRLRVLLAYANPSTDPTGRFPPLPRLHDHFQALRTALDPLIHDGLVFLEVLSNPTPEALRTQVGQFNPHVLVYAGHGYHEAHTRGGLVCVHAGEPALLPFAELASTLGSLAEPALRLGVFIACRSFAAAPLLLRVGVPAVVAMQRLGMCDFPLAGMRSFAGAFFRKLGHLEPLGEAYAAGVSQLAEDAPAAAAMPTWWLAGAHDRLFASAEERFRALYLDALLGKPEVALLPFPDVDDGIAFENLYVDQAVVEEQREKPAESASPEADQAMQRAVDQEVVKQVEVDLWEKLQSRHRVRVEAPAWMGKSTLCRWVVHQCHDPKSWLPIFVRFSDLASSGQSLLSYLCEDYAEWLGLEGREIEVELPDGRKESRSLGRWLYDRWQAGQALLVLDGADEEFDRVRRHQVLSSLPDSKQGAARARVLLTSRPLGEGGVLGFETLALRAFGRPQIERLVRCCGEALEEEERAEGFIQALGQVADGQAMELASRPGHLVQMLATYLHEGVVLTAEAELMDRVADRRFAITGRVTQSLNPDKPVYKRQMAEELAFHFLFCRGGKPLNWLKLTELAGHALQGVGYTGTLAERDILLEDLGRNSGFLRPTSRQTWSSNRCPGCNSSPPAIPLAS